MELATDCIVSKERWDPQREERQQVSISEVRDFAQQGLLSKCNNFLDPSYIRLAKADRA
jgi:FAD synthase